MHHVHARLLATGVLLAFGAVGASAECVGFQLAHYLKYADVVFRGVVTEARHLDEPRAIITFSVSRVWKGAVGRHIVLHQGEQTSLDRYSWPADAIGGEYLVFATRLSESQRQAFELKTTDAFAVPMCGGGTTEIAKAQQYLNELGLGRAP